MLIKFTCSICDCGRYAAGEGANGVADGYYPPGAEG